MSKTIKHKATQKARELTPQEAALTSPLEFKTPLSLPWCHQFIDALKQVWARKNFTEQYWEERLAEFAKHEPWKVYPPERPYGSLDALLKAEIGVDVKESCEAVKMRAARFDGSELSQPEIGKGKAGPGRGHKTGDVITRFERGTAADYLTARIARDRPDILKRMKAGEFSSVRQAAKEAGIVRERISIALDPVKAAEAIFRHFSLREAEAASDRLSDLIAEAKGKQ